MTNKNETHKYSPEEILKIISETYSLTEEELGLYLRRQGLHSHQLTEWKNNILNSMNKPTPSPAKKDDRDKKIKELEKNLKKKNAALAEVSALLILEKKCKISGGKRTTTRRVNLHRGSPQNIGFNSRGRQQGLS
jgi:hypothetical protein